MLHVILLARSSGTGTMFSDLTDEKHPTGRSGLSEAKSRCTALGVNYLAAAEV
jgi:hypothetical protein